MKDFLQRVKQHLHEFLVWIGLIEEESLDLIDRVKNRIKKLRDLKTDLDQKAGTQRRKLNNTKTKISELNKGVEFYENKLEKIQGESEGEDDNVHEVLSKAKNTLERKRSRLNSLLERKELYQEQVDELEGRVVDLESKIVSLQNKVEDLKFQKDTFEAEKKEDEAEGSYDFEELDRQIEKTERMKEAFEKVSA